MYERKFCLATSKCYKMRRLAIGSLEDAGLFIPLGTVVWWHTGVWGIFVERLNCEDNSRGHFIELSCRMRGAWDRAAWLAIIE